MWRTKGAKDYQVRDADTLDGAPGDGPLDRGVLTRTGGRRGSDSAPPPRNSSRANPSTGRSPGEEPDVTLDTDDEAGRSQVSGGRTGTLSVSAGVPGNSRCPRFDLSRVRLLRLLQYDPGEFDT